MTAADGQSFPGSATKRTPSTVGGGAAGPGERNPTPDRLLVSRALTQLCTDYRAVIYRSYYQGLTTAQIAASLGIAEAAAKSKLHDALRELRQTLQETTLPPAVH